MPSRPSTPRVSIAMTTYNAGPWLSGQIESFVRQSLPPDQLVICDDGSTDGTIDALHRFAAEAPFEVQVVCNEQNLTTTPNFEQAVSLCRGEFIFFADQDDVWHDDKIETLVGVLEADPDTGAVFSNGRVVDENLTPLGYTLWDSLWFRPAEREAVKQEREAEVFVRHVVAAGTTLAFRASLRDAFLPFPDLHDCHDAWVTFSICGVARVRIVERDLIEYRLHGQNQFGLQRFNLREQLVKAKEQLEIGAFHHNVVFFTTARDRFRTLADAGFALRPEVVALAEGKIRHAKLRDEMSGGFFRRLPTVLGETLNRGYWRFGYGAKSLAQDLFLR